MSGLTVPAGIAARYEVRRTLGRGAMGVVLDAVDRNIERRVAIKLVRRPPPGDAEAAEAHARFKREAQAAGRLQHPNIVAVYEFGEDEAAAWIVMEMVAGGSLKERLDRGERFPVHETVRLMEQVLAALAYSHGRGVVHRDIKPANIMLAEDGEVKLADFGIARIENSSMTQLGTMMGTPSYMAPEQFRGETVDPRADLWAAGVLLYQLLTGEKPFEGGFSAVMHKALHSEPTPPSAISVTTPRGFDPLIARALAKRPAERFPTAGAFAEAIRAAAEAPPAALPMEAADPTMVRAPAARAAAPGRPPPAPPLAAAAARKRAPVGLIAGGALLVAGGVAAFLLLGQGGGPPTPAPAPVVALAPSAPAGAAAAPGLAAPAPAAAALPLGAAPSPAPPPAPAATLPPVAQPPPLLPAQPPAAAPPAAAAAPPLAPAAPLPAAPPVAAPTGTAAEPRSPAQPSPAAPPALTSAPLPLPTPPPAPQAAPQLALQHSLAAPPRPTDFRSALATALDAAPCGLLAGSADEAGLSLGGVLARGQQGAVQRALGGLPAGSARARLEPFDGPYCPAMAALRPVLAGLSDPPQVTVAGNTPLRRGELLRFQVTMPAWPAHLYVAYFMKSGEVAHLVPSRQQAAGAVVPLGEPGPGFPGWEVDEPFGTDLMVIVASEQPLLPGRRPGIEQQDAYLQGLSEAIATARARGARVAVRPLVVETADR